MGNTQETAGPLKLGKLLKGRFPTTKEARDVLSDLGMLSIGYFCAVLGEIGKTKTLTIEDIESIFESLKNPLSQTR